MKLMRRFRLVTSGRVDHAQLEELPAVIVLPPESARARGRSQLSF